MAGEVPALPVVHLLDYKAGNVRSVRNAIKKVGLHVVDVTTPADLDAAQVLVFPGVGAFGSCVNKLKEQGFWEPLRAYIASGKPLMGICLGMQLLFEASEETPGVEGLGVIPGVVAKFDNKKMSVPQIGWNGVALQKPSAAFANADEASSLFYFVHSFRAATANNDWTLTLTDYGGDRFVSSVAKGRILATQFHPEKSGRAGLRLLDNFLRAAVNTSTPTLYTPTAAEAVRPTFLSRRVIACLDVRSNDAGDLVVTKGDQYDVREADGGHVRNLGKPVQLAQRYFEEGADEVTFLNITSFRECPLEDTPMLEVLRRASEEVFVPLTIGGGIRDIPPHSALEVATEYFRSGADKVSIGSEAVYAAEAYYANGARPTGTSPIEQIAYVYGAQAVVVSVDPRRVYVARPEDTPHHVIKVATPGPAGEAYAWYQCTVKGGREGRDLDVIQLVKACEALGAGEILLNCIDQDGTKAGFDIPLIDEVRKNVSVPVIASSGAGTVQHFEEVFNKTGAEAALAAGIFHRNEVPLGQVKDYLGSVGMLVRK